MERNNSLSSSLDTIKVYTLLLVVIGHVLRMYTPAGAFPHAGSAITSHLCALIYSFHMPLFILVSGAVYGICRNRGKYNSYKNLCINKSRRILLPYFVFGILVLAPCLVYVKLTDSYLNYCILDICIGGV